MRRFLLFCLLTLAGASSAWALPAPSRTLAAYVSGNTYNAYSPIVTLTSAERYATVKLRPTAGNTYTAYAGLYARLATTASPDTYTANAEFMTLEPGELRELWNYKLFGTAVTWYGSTTATAGDIILEIQTFKNTVP